MPSYNAASIARKLPAATLEQADEHESARGRLASGQRFVIKSTHSLEVYFPAGHKTVLTPFVAYVPAGAHVHAVLLLAL